MVASTAALAIVIYDCNFFPCSTRLEVFQCPERNNIRKIEKKGRKKPPSLDRF